MIITISGFHGTGKSTIARAIAEEFNLRYIAAGDLFRQMAKEKQMSIEEFSKYAEQNPEIDHLIDTRTIDEAKNGNVIIDGLLAAWKTRTVSNFNILLIASTQTRIERIALRENRPYEEIKNETLIRENIEIERFKKLYDIDLNNYSIYDVVLNTALWSKESIIHVIIILIKEHLKSMQKPTKKA